MVSVGRDFKDSLIPTPMAGLPLRLLDCCLSNLALNALTDGTSTFALALPVPVPHHPEWL